MPEIDSRDPHVFYCDGTGKCRICGGPHGGSHLETVEQVEQATRTYYDGIVRTYYDGIVQDMHVNDETTSLPFDSEALSRWLNIVLVGGASLALLSSARRRS